LLIGMRISKAEWWEYTKKHCKWNDEHALVVDVTYNGEFFALQPTTRPECHVWVEEMEERYGDD